MKRVFIFYFFLVLAIPGLMAQESLEVFKPGSLQRYHFNGGDTVCVKLQQQPERVCGPWAYIDQETIFLEGSLVKLDSIEWVDVSGKRKTPKWNLPANFLIAAGIGYIAVDQVNSLILDGGTGVNPRVIRSGAYLAAAGLIIKGLAYATRPPAKARIGKKYKIFVTDYSTQ